MSEVKDFISEVNKAFGKEHPVIMVAGEQGAFAIPRLSTGILPIDHATGGGIPVGAFTRVFGKESSGKSTLALKIVATAQRTCKNCLENLELECKCGEKNEDREPMRVLWIDAEGTFEKSWAVQMGVKSEELIVMVPQTGEQAVDVATSAIKSGLFQLLVIDSIAMLVPLKEQEESAEKALIGVQPRLVNRAIRDWTAALNRYGVGTYKRPTILMINQIRMKTDGYGNPETQPGGRAQFHASMVDISMRQGQVAFAGERPARGEFKFSIPKNKSAPPKMTGTFRMWLTKNGDHEPGDTEEDKEIFTCLEKLGLIQEEKKGSAKRWIYEGEVYETKQALTSKLADPASRLLARKRVLSALINGDVKTEESEVNDE